ncbi:MAG: TetR/AcrR family transcriptional regulator [Spirochaetaceae bacterium]|jgi:AcrR family transcriptional regulator|nr:TetR/AcrR family transcriptional regulator [Spirochaetaceae bacterium]
MSIKIEHEKRKHEILEKAMDVFIDEGFENTTIQKIAKHCGISRPILYTYFKNKRDIFNYSIKHLLSMVEQKLVQELHGQKSTAHKPEKSSAVDTLVTMLMLIIDILEKNKKLLNVLIDYLLYISKHKEAAGNKTPDYLIRKRTIKLRHILSEVVIDGIKSGEIKNIDVSVVNNLLYGLLKSAILELTVIGKSSASEVKQTASLAVRLLGTAQEYV